MKAEAHAMPNTLDVKADSWSPRGCLHLCLSFASWKERRNTLVLWEVTSSTVSGSICPRRSNCCPSNAKETTVTTLGHEHDKDARNLIRRALKEMSLCCAKLMTPAAAGT
eukprot:4297172-Amphidinium_carterae.1